MWFAEVKSQLGLIHILPLSLRNKRTKLAYFAPHLLGLLLLLLFKVDLPLIVFNFVNVDGDCAFEWVVCLHFDSKLGQIVQGTDLLLATGEVTGAILVFNNLKSYVVVVLVFLLELVAFGTARVGILLELLGLLDLSL